MKKQNHILHLLFFILPGMLFFACTEPIILDTDDAEPVMVVYSIITDQMKHQEVRLSMSSPYFSDEPNPTVSGAEVEISSSDGEIYHFIEDINDPGSYRSDYPWAVREGVTYYLNIEAGEKKYGSHTTVLHSPQLDSIRVDPIRIMGHSNYDVKVFGQDPPTEDYYLFKAVVNDTIVTVNMKNLSISDDILFNGEYINGISVFRFDHVSERENDDEERQKGSVYIQPGDHVQVQLSIIPKGYSDFILQCVSEQNGENPMFGGPASNITTNITGGAVGYFTGYTIRRTSTIVLE